MDPFDRLMARVDTSGDCWVFTGRPTASGYSQVGGKHGHHYGHRLTYERLVGPIPDGWVVHHECENKVCVNPTHLNVKPNAQHATEHAVERGHGGDACVTCGATDWHRRQDGRRDCRVCSRRSALAYYHRTKKVT